MSETGNAANQSVEIASWSVDLVTRQVTRTPNHDAFFGYAENLAFWNIEHFLTHVHAEDADIFTGRFRDAVAKSESFDFCFRVVWKDGSVRELRTEGRIAFTSGGVPFAVIGTTRFNDPSS